VFYCKLNRKIRVIDGRGKGRVIGTLPSAIYYLPSKMDAVIVRVVDLVRDVDDVGFAQWTTTVENHK
jgi:hypothetical protein